MNIEHIARMTALFPQESHGVSEGAWERLVASGARRLVFERSVLDSDEGRMMGIQEQSVGMYATGDGFRDSLLGQVVVLGDLSQALFSLHAVRPTRETVELVTILIGNTGAIIERSVDETFRPGFMAKTAETVLIRRGHRLDHTLAGPYDMDKTIERFLLQLEEMRYSDTVDVVPHMNLPRGY